MSRWSIAEWVGPTPNRTVGGMVESRGLVLHIMQGSYDGSIAWGKNPASSVSFHFATRGDGHLGQLVDTADAAWTQANGNGHWISVENEGFSGNPLTNGQVEACAQLYAEGVRVYGWPLQTTDSPNGFGLGWHGMGGTAWGGHFDCPGEPIKAQRPAILARAEAILNGGTMDWSDELANQDGKGPAGIYLAYANQYAYHGGKAAHRAEYLLRGLVAMQDPIVIPANDRLDIKQAESVPNLLARSGNAGGLTFDQTVEAARQGANLAEDSS